MLRYAWHVGFALVLLLIQGTLLSRIFTDVARPDLAFLVVLYLGLRHPIGEATLPVVVIAYLADRFTALPDGTFLLLYLTLFTLASGISKVFYSRGLGFPALMALGLSLLYGLGMTVMERVGRVSAPGESLIRGIPWGFLAVFAILNVLCSVPIFKLCRVIDGEEKIRSSARRSLY